MQAEVERGFGFWKDFYEECRSFREVVVEVS